jgi:tetratricopeptide (TPR) repeat protein
MRILLPLLIISFSAHAADSPAPAAPSDPVIERYQQAAGKQDWPAAAGVLREAVAKDPANARYHNLYAYSLRRGPSPDMSLVFKHYNEALRIDPEHRGAHEYIGEAYLMVGNLDKAKEHLKVLDRLCFFPCDEHTQLKRAISQHEKK